MGYVQWFLNHIKQFGYFGSMAIVAGLMVVGTSPIGGVLYSAIQIGAGYAFGWPAWPAVYVGALVGDLIAYQFCSLWLLQGKTPEQLASAMPGKTAQRWARAITLGINDEDYRFFFAAAGGDRKKDSRSPCPAACVAPRAAPRAALVGFGFVAC
jgi:hypothetical protein